MLLSMLMDKIEYTKAINDCEIDHITNDSREARFGSIFVCVKGFNTDGHLYAPRAYENGCRVFVCEHRPKLLPDDATEEEIEDKFNEDNGINPDGVV